VRAVGGHLPGDPLHQAAVLFKPGAPFLQLLDGLVVFVAHLRNRIGLPEQIRNLVDLRDERRPEFVENHNNSLRVRRSYWLGGSSLGSPVREVYQGSDPSRRRASASASSCGLVTAGKAKSRLSSASMISSA